MSTDAERTAKEASSTSRSRAHTRRRYDRVISGGNHPMAGTTTRGLPEPLERRIALLGGDPFVTLHHFDPGNQG